MTMQEMLARDVQSYAKTLADIVSGNDAFRELAEDADTNEYDFDSEYDRLRWYFEDCLDVEFHVDSQLRYKGATITLACGGPGIKFDTHSGEVKGCSWSDRADWSVDYDTRRAIDDYWAEMFELIRESH